MALNKVEICGLDTSKLPMMTQKRSRELLLRVKGGDEAARETFIRENLRLVLSVIQRFAGRSEQMDDLFQVGCIGLIKALDNFDLSHNVRFSTYAVPMKFPCRGKEEAMKTKKEERVQSVVSEDAMLAYLARLRGLCKERTELQREWKEQQKRTRARCPR